MNVVVTAVMWSDGAGFWFGEMNVRSRDSIEIKGRRDNALSIAMMLLMFVLFLAQPAHADTVTAFEAIGITGIDPVASGTGALLVKGAAPDPETRTLISFDLSDSKFDAGFETATLNIDYLTVPIGPASWNIHAYTAGSGALLASNFAPAADSLLPGGPFDVLGTAGTFSLDITTILSAALSDAFLIFNIQGATATTWVFPSDPNIELTALAPVPIPAALPLFLVGLAAMGVVARRRKSGPSAVSH